MVEVHILGVAQDGGIPHLGCRCHNCQTMQKRVASLGIVTKKQRFVIDATPNITEQIGLLGGLDQVNAMFLTHLHIGHYIGLAHLGREVAATQNFDLYMTQELADYLRANKPFSYLIERGQIKITILKPDNRVEFDEISIIPFEVPHRNEDGNTVGYNIINSVTNKSCIYIPDIDYIDSRTIERIENADIVIFDGSFYSDNELEFQENVPHPPITKTIEMLGKIFTQKFYFIHFNHTNPVLNSKKLEEQLNDWGYMLAKEGLVLDL